MDKNSILRRQIRESVLYRLDDLRMYAADIELKFHSDKARLHRRSEMETSRKTLNPDVKRQLEDSFAEDYYMIEDLFLVVFRYSMIVALYSHLERTLIDICEFLHGFDHLTVSFKKHETNLKKSRLSKIENATSYIKDIGKISLPLGTSNWAHIRDLNKIRNCIVHSEGDVTAVKTPEQTKQLKRIVGSTNGLSLKYDRFIRVEEVYVEATISNVEGFLKQVVSKII